VSGAAERHPGALETVPVTDGRLTVANGSGASNNAICFIVITGS